MSKLFRLRDYILFTAALAGDVIDELKMGGGIVPIALQNRYGFVPSDWKRSSYTSEISRMLSTKEISKEIDKRGRVFLKLTSKGEKKFSRKFPIFMKSGKWDGKFMVVIYDVEEENKTTREYIRKELVRLGFGMMQKSVWISPYHFESEMKEYLSNNNLSDKVAVLTARTLWVDDQKTLAEKIWKLRKINERYKNLSQRIEKMKIHNGARSKRNLRVVFSSYLDILESDPMLPRELLPEKWYRDRVMTLLNKGEY